jgi:hypothetical protein
MSVRLDGLAVAWVDETRVVVTDWFNQRDLQAPRPRYWIVDVTSGRRTATIRLPENMPEAWSAGAVVGSSAGLPAEVARRYGF